MKKVFNILLVASIFINSCGYLLIYQQMILDAKREIRMRMKESIQPEDCDIIVVGNGHSASVTISWLEEDEFSYNGKLYDVVKREVKKDAIVYYCLNDAKEDTLVRNLINFESQNQKTKSRRSNAERSSRNVITQAIIKNAFSLEAGFLAEGFAYYHTSLYQSYIKQVQTPPPILPYATA